MYNVNKWNENEYVTKLNGLINKYDDEEDIYGLIHEYAKQFEESLSLQEKLINLPSINESFVDTMNMSEISCDSVEEFIKSIYIEYMESVLFESIE